MRDEWKCPALGVRRLLRRLEGRSVARTVRPFWERIPSLPWQVKLSPSQSTLLAVSIGTAQFQAQPREIVRAERHSGAARSPTDCGTNCSGSTRAIPWLLPWKEQNGLLEMAEGEAERHNLGSRHLERRESDGEAEEETTVGTSFVSKSRVEVARGWYAAPETRRIPRPVEHPAGQRLSSVFAKLAGRP